MALSPWPTSGSDRDDAVAVLAAAVVSSDGAPAAKRLGPVGRGYGAGMIPPARHNRIRGRSGYPHGCGWLYESTPGLADSKMSAGPVDSLENLFAGLECAPT